MRRLFAELIAVLAVATAQVPVGAQAKVGTPTAYVSTKSSAGAFALATSGRATTLYVSVRDHRGVIRAVNDLRADIERVTGAAPIVSTTEVPSGQVVIVGTLGNSPVIDQLVREKRLDATPIAGKWEAFLTEVVERPLPGVSRALVIAGSDKRGTIYGIYDLSSEIGVSPW